MPGHYSRWILDHKTGQRKRLQRAFNMGPTSALTKTQARENYDTESSKEAGITADSRVTAGGFIDYRIRWKKRSVTVIADQCAFDSV